MELVQGQPATFLANIEDDEELQQELDADRLKQNVWLPGIWRPCSPNCVPREKSFWRSRKTLCRPLLVSGPEM